MGYRAGYGLTTGSDNILLGFKAGDNITTGAGNIVIGYEKDTSAPAANNELNIGGLIYGDLSAGRVGIGAAGPASSLSVGTPGNATLSYTQIDTLDDDTAGPPPPGDCAASTIGRMTVSSRYSATEEYRLWICVKTGAAAYIWKYAALN